MDYPNNLTFKSLTFIRVLAAQKKGYRINPNQFQNQSADLSQMITKTDPCGGTYSEITFSRLWLATKTLIELQNCTIANTRPKPPTRLRGKRSTTATTNLTPSKAQVAAATAASDEEDEEDEEDEDDEDELEEGEEPEEREEALGLLIR